MTVSTEISRNTAVGNGATQTFSFAFKILAETDLVVTYFGPTYASAGEIQVLNTDYTVDSFGESGGDVTTTATLTSDDTIEIKRELAYTQLVDFVQNATFDAQVMEDLADKLTFLSQQAYSEAQLGVKMAGGAEEDTDYLMPVPEDGKFPVGNVSGGWDNKEIGDLSATSITVPVAVAEGGTGGTTAALARTNLGLGTAAVLDTGTAAGELPKNSDLGSASLKDAGSSSDEVVLLDANGRMPAVSVRNVTDGRTFTLLAEQEVAVYTGTVASYDFASLAAHDQYLVELLNVGVDTDNAEVVLEAYIGATLYGVGGTTGQYDGHHYWRKSGGAATELGQNATDFLLASPNGWLYDSGVGAHESHFSVGILVTNNENKFSVADRQWARFSYIWGDGLFGSNAADPTSMHLWGGSGYLMTNGLVNGFRVRIEHGSAAYFNRGVIRIWGVNNLWTNDGGPVHI